MPSTRISFHRTFSYMGGPFRPSRARTALSRGGYCLSTFDMELELSCAVLDAVQIPDLADELDARFQKHASPHA